MAGRGARFLRGFARTGSAATKRLVEGLIYFDEIEKQRKVEERQARQDAQNERYTNARIAEMQEPKEEKPLSETEYLSQLLQSDPEKYYGHLKRKEEITRKPEKAESDEPDILVDSEGKVSIRGKNPEKVRTQMINLNIPHFKADKPEQPKPLTQDQIVDTEEKILGITFSPTLGDNETPNPFYGKADSLRQAWGIPSAQPESVTAKPATGALAPFKFDFGDLKDKVGGGTPATAPTDDFIPDMNNPDIAKAYQALKNKQMSEEQFYRFAKEQMGQ